MIANFLSALRFPLALALIPLLWHAHWLWALTLVLIAIASDVTDGYVARNFAHPTRLGGFLDHGSDAFLVVCGLGTFAARSDIPTVLPILISLAFFQYLWDSGAMTRGALRASLIGKMNGLAYIVFLVVLIGLNALQIRDQAHTLLTATAWILVVSTLLSKVDRARHTIQAARTPNS